MSRNTDVHGGRFIPDPQYTQTIENITNYFDVGTVVIDSEFPSGSFTYAPWSTLPINAYRLEFYCQMNNVDEQLPASGIQLEFSLFTTGGIYASENPLIYGWSISGEGKHHSTVLVWNFTKANPNATVNIVVTKLGGSMDVCNIGGLCKIYAAL